jgi:hypothetical protein
MGVDLGRGSKCWSAQDEVLKMQKNHKLHRWGSVFRRRHTGKFVGRQRCRNVSGQGPTPASSKFPVFGLNQNLKDVIMRGAYRQESF